MTKKQESVWEVLSSINVNDKIEKKNGLTYLSWSWAWAEVKKRYPSATYRIYRNPDTKQPYDFTPEVGYMCYTYVTIEGQELEMWLPVMDYRNKSMINNATTFDINKTIMRCLVKNLAMFGLGHYIYSGEDLPEGDNSLSSQPTAPKPPTNTRKPLKSGTDLFNRAITALGKGETTIDKVIAKYEVSKSDVQLLMKAVNG